MSIDKITKILFSGTNATYFKNNPIALKNTAEAIANYPKFLQSTLANSELNIMQYLLSLSLGSALMQSFQEFMTQLLPKVTVAFYKNIQSAYTDQSPDKTLAEKIQENLKLATINSFDEMSVEILEYIAIYFCLTFFAAANAQHISQILKIPHYEMLGQRLFDLQQNIGKSVIYGTVRPKQVTLTQDIYKKIALGKTLNFVAAALVAMCAEVGLTSLRVLFTKGIFGESNFYKLSGLHNLNIDEQAKNNGDAALYQAGLNAKYFLSAIPLIFAGFLGLTHLAQKGNFHNHKFFASFSKRFDFNNKFDLSRTAILFPLMVGATIGYDLTARNLAEVKENITRMVFQSWFAILFFKNIVGTALTWLTGLYFTKKNIIGNPFKTWHNEVLGKKAGARDLFDLQFGKIDQLKKNPDVLKLNPKKQERFFRTIKHVQDFAPTWYFAYPFGVTVAALWNYPRTQKLYQDEISGKGQDAPKNIIEEFIDRFARFLYGIQQNNYQNYLKNQEALITSF